MSENETKPMQRYWASWWSGNYADEGCTRTPYRYFVSGMRYRNDGRDEESLCMWFEADSEDAVRAAIMPHFPDYEERFIQAVDDDWKPNDRFPGIELYRIQPSAPTAGATGGDDR